MSRTNQLFLPKTAFWLDLGAWNIYFLTKFTLAIKGYLTLQPIPNLVLVAALLLPLKWKSVGLLRTLVAIPIAIALLYQETWLPPFKRLLEQSESILGFSSDYLLELLGRFINLELVGLLFALMVVYLFLAQWLRMTTLTLVVLLWLTITPWLNELPTQPTQMAVAATNANVKQVTDKPDDLKLNTQLEQFYRSESERHTSFPAKEEAGAPFDLLLVNICSMAWDDLDAVGLRDNALLKQMDILFDNFNSATSYSGPAAIRLLRASCGQSSHRQLYEPASQQCLLFDELKKLGFSGELTLNHDGSFESYLDSLRQQTGMPLPAVDIKKLRKDWISFYGPPLWSDKDVLTKWWQHRQQLTSERLALFYNTITLHDGNRVLLASGETRPADYKERTQHLLSDLTAFISELQRSGRRIVLVIVPEHGAALHGDAMQISGMREIPTLSITHVPVGIKLIGMDAVPHSEPLHVTAPSSYLALSEIVARLYRIQSFQEQAGFDWQQLIAHLPETIPVSENAGAVVQEYDGVPYVRIKEQGTWLPYPHRFK